MIQVRQTFPTDTLARDFEHKVLRRLDVIHNDQWLNKANGKCPTMLGVPKSEDHKAKIGAANKGVPKSESHKAKISAAKMGNTASKGITNALNIETGVVAGIPLELYHSRRDIYFHPTSKVFQQWKSNQQ